VIASQSGHRLPPLSVAQNAALATTPVEELLALPMLQPDQVTDSLRAYQLAKRGNSLRVMAEAVRWGKRGARLNTISPGIIITPLAKDELTGPRGPGYRRMIEVSAAGRAGTPDEVGNVGALLMGTRRRLHHRRRLPHGWRRHRGLLVRRIGTEMSEIDGFNAAFRRIEEQAPRRYTVAIRPMASHDRRRGAAPEVAARCK
jgi:hypothetical protein